MVARMRAFRPSGGRRWTTRGRSRLGDRYAWSRSVIGRFAEPGLPSVGDVDGGGDAPGAAVGAEGAAVAALDDEGGPDVPAVAVGGHAGVAVARGVHGVGAAPRRQP